MVSGIGVHPDVVPQFADMKLRRTAKWMIFMIQDEKIIVERTGLGGADEFESHLPATDCRYGVFDKDSRIQFVMWCPDKAPVKPRMVYATSKDALVSRLEGANWNSIEAHEKDDLLQLKKKTDNDNDDNNNNKNNNKNIRNNM